MQYNPFLLTVFCALLLVGCQRQPSTVNAPNPEQAEAIAKQLREAMTAPWIMKLDMEGRHGDSLRAYRQCEIGQPIMYKLIECGLAAKEPIWQLINDGDASVRRSCAKLLANTRTNADLQTIEPQLINDLQTPLLERALHSEDEQVRFLACGGLGNFANWSNDCLERLKHSLPEIRKLRNDGDKSVRGIAWISSTSIASALSSRAKLAADRDTASELLKELESEKYREQLETGALQSGGHENPGR
jgi:hypothetical protein